MTAQADIGALEASGLVGLAAMEPELEYLFRHVLVQDAAYASLLKQERRELHRRVADALLQLYPERRGELAGVIGMHLEEAGEPQRAAPYLVEAGAAALARFAHREARAFFDRAYAAIPAGATDPETQRLGAHAGIGGLKAGWTFMPRGADLARLAELVLIVESLGDPRLAAEVHFWNVFLRRSGGETPQTSDELRRSTERLAQLGEAMGDPLARAMPEALLGAGLAFSGQIRAGAAMLEKAIPTIEEAGDALAAALLYDVLTIFYARLGEFAAAERTAGRAERLAERGDPIARLDAKLARTVIASERGELEDAVRLASECVITSEELGATGCAIPANYFLGDGRLRLGDAETAKAPFERTMQLAATDLRPLSALATLAQAGLAAAVASLGDVSGASAGWQGSVAAARRTGDRFAEATILARRAATLARAASPDWPALLADLETATATLEEIETRPALARALHAYGAALRRVGRDADAEAAERRARGIAREIGLRDRDLVG